MSKEKEICAYCGKPADGAMLCMGSTMAHFDCVIRKLNELLDPDYEGEGEPSKIIGSLYKPKPDKDRRSLVATILDQECQKRVERIFREIEKNSYYWLRDKNAKRGFGIPLDFWQALKEKEGLDD